MDAWIDSCEFRRLEIDEDEVITIEGGIDEFERIRRETDSEEEQEIHIYLLSKRTELFEIEMRWKFNPEEFADESAEEITDLARNHIRTLASHAIATYLDQMDLPPIQAILTDGISVTLSTEIEADDSED